MKLTDYQKLEQEESRLKTELSLKAARIRDLAIEALSAIEQNEISEHAACLIAIQEISQNLYNKALILGRVRREAYPMPPEAGQNAPIPYPQNED